MEHAVVVRPPVFGATVVRFDDRAAKAVAGVRTVVEIATGVAVVAEQFWQAKKGAEALTVEWSASPLDSATTASLRPTTPKPSPPAGGSGKHRRCRRCSGWGDQDRGSRVLGPLPSPRPHGAHERRGTCEGRQRRAVGRYPRSGDRPAALWPAMRGSNRPRSWCTKPTSGAPWAPGHAHPRGGSNADL